MNQDLKIIKTVFMPGQKKGKKVYDEQEGKRGKRENLVAGRRKKRKSFNSANYIQRKSKCRGIWTMVSSTFITITKVKSSQIKLDKKELEKDVKQNPESSIGRQSQKIWS